MSSKARSRLGAANDKLTKIWTDYQENPRSEVLLDQLKSVISKLQQLLSGNEKCCKDVLTKYPNIISILHDLVKFFSKVDGLILLQVLECIQHLIVEGKGTMNIYNAGGLRIFCESFSASIEALQTKDTMQDMWIIYLTLLNKIGTKEKKFATVLRLSGVLEGVLQLLALFSANHKVLVPILQLLKVASSSAANALLLVKGGVINTLMHVLPLCGQKRTQMFKLCLDLFGVLCKTKTGSKKAVSLGVLPLLLTTYQDWHRSDHRNRQILIRKAILNAIKACLNFKLGRKAFEAIEGYRTMYFLGLEGIENKELEGVLRIIIAILRKCAPSKTLAIDSLHSTLTFPLPTHYGREHRLNEDHGELAEKQSIVEESSENSSDDTESALDSDGEVNDCVGEREDSTQSISTCTSIESHQGPVEVDYSQYDKFFQELFDAQEAVVLPNTHQSPQHSISSHDSSPVHQHILTTSSAEDINDPIWIPTAEHEHEVVHRHNSISPNILEVTKEEIDRYQSCTSCCFAISNQLQHFHVADDDNDADDDDDTDEVEDDDGGREMKNAVVNSCSCPEPIRSLSIKKESLQQVYSEKLKHQSAFELMHASSSTCKPSNSTLSICDDPQKKGLLMFKTLMSTFRYILYLKFDANVLKHAFFQQIVTCNLYKINIFCLHVHSHQNFDVAQEKIVFSKQLRQYSGSSTQGPGLQAQGSEQMSSEDKKLKTPWNLTPVHSILPSVVDTSPTIYGHRVPIHSEALLEKKQYLNRLLMFQDFARVIFPDKVIERVVYDLDSLLKYKDRSKTSLREDGVNLQSISGGMRKCKSMTRLSPVKRNQNSFTGVLSQTLTKNDVLRMKPLSFESRFESGNLRKATQVRQYEYDLILNPDINCNHHHQWFYFQITNMECDVNYRFNIINCEKPNSQFNFGMQPVFYSDQSAREGCPGWERLGSNVCYYRNHYVKGKVESNKNYYTATFTISFPFNNDTCYLAYHYPYTLTMLKTQLYRLQNYLLPNTIYFRNDQLCQTLSKNDVNVVTITALPLVSDDVIVRPYILLTARVHPGESNSSWVMKGLLDFLVSNSPQAKQLRHMYIFKIVPMLNPDGVVNGSHRCSLSGQDLNRQWKRPNALLHPSIYHTKNLLYWMKMINKTPSVFVDFHGHSRKKNVFMYGCTPTNIQASASNHASAETTSPTKSEIDNDICSGVDSTKLLPCVLNEMAPIFSLQNCAFTMEKSKDATARIVGFREFNIARCYTMESTYSGMDQGPYKGNQIGTRELEEMGRYFCLGLLRMSYSPSVRLRDEDVILPNR